jgi:hypothetical protein
VQLEQTANPRSGRPGHVGADAQEATRTCYDGDAFRRVLQLGGDAQQRARAVLGLTRPGREPQGVSDRQAQHEWAAQAFAELDVAGLSPTLQQKVQLRRVTLWASLAFERGRAGQTGEAEPWPRARSPSWRC